MRSDRSREKIRHIVISQRDEWNDAREIGGETFCWTGPANPLLALGALTLVSDLRLER